MDVGTVDIMETKKRSVTSISKKELDIGTRVEKKEHGFNLKTSRKIAMDHIKEFPRYYTHKVYGLIAMEKRIKRLIASSRNI